MMLKANFSTWSPWVTYRTDYGREYQSRSRKLFCGNVSIAVLVQSTKRAEWPFFIYASGLGPRGLVRGKNAYDTVRRFIREKLLQ